MQEILGQLFAVGTAACWGQNSVVYSLAGKRVTSNTVATVRLCLAIVPLFFIHYLITKTFFPTGLALRAYLFIFGSGLMGFFIADILIFKAFVDLGPRETMVIQTLSPLFSALFAYFFFTETLSILEIAGMLATIGGVAWVIMIEGKGGGKWEKVKVEGVVYAVLGAVGQSVGMILAKGGLESGLHPVSANFLRMMSGVAGLVLFAALRGQLIRDFAKMKDHRSFFLILSGALIGPVLGVILAMYAISLAPVGIATALMQTSPIMLLPVDRFIFKKQIPPQAVAATFLAIFGVVLLFVF